MVVLYLADALPLKMERMKTAFEDTIFTCQYVPTSLSPRSLACRSDVSLGRDWFVAHKLHTADVKDAHSYHWNTPGPVPNAPAPRQGVLHTPCNEYLFCGTKFVLGLFFLFAARVLIGWMSYGCV